MNAKPNDRAAAVRKAMRSLVAGNGFHGASMGAVAKEAGVATGTAYTHYASKDALVIAAYVETKAELGRAATAGIDAAQPAADRFRALWLACYRHLSHNRDHALYLLQVETSPYREPAHEASMAKENDGLLAQVASPDLATQLMPLPLDVLFDLALGPAIRLAATGVTLEEEQLADVAGACWRAVTKPQAGPAPGQQRR